MKKRIQVGLFDTETNGYKGSSVLSISFIKLELWIEYGRLKCKKIGELNEFFQPIEQWNKSSSEIHSITKQNVEEYRLNNKVFKNNLHFQDEFVQQQIKTLLFSADLLVAHNIGFDISFMKFPYPKNRQYDTMVELTPVMKLPHPKYGNKSPKLKEAASYYGIEMDESQLHGSLYDTRILSKVVYAMLQDKETKLMDKIIKLIKEKNE